MSGRFGFLLILSGALLALYALISLWRIQYRLNRQLAYLWLVSIALLTAAHITLKPGAFLWTTVVIPLGLYALVQIPLVIFRARQDDALGLGPAALRHGSLTVLALIFVIVGADLVVPSATTPLRDRVVTLIIAIGFPPFLASSYLLMKAGWRIAKPWGLGLNFVTAAAVLPAFVQEHPSEAKEPARRFLFWLIVTGGVAFLDDTLGTPDARRSAGVAIFTVGSIALIGATVWLVVSVLRRRSAMVTRSLATMAASAIVGGIGVLMFGDLPFDRHTFNAAGRTFADRAFGCTGNRQHATLLIQWSKHPVAGRLKPMRASVTPTAPPETYDPAAAVLLAQASTLVYMTPCEIEKAVKEWSTPDWRVVSLGSPSVAVTASGDCDSQESPRDQAMILADDRRLILAFRGTNQVANWRTNLDVVPRSLFDPQWTHRGFSDALERQWAEILSTVQRLRDNNQTVWATGHSLGGAVAVLAAARIQAAGIPVQGVYTFGQPRVASEAVAKELNSRIPAYYRFVMHSDTVPDLGSPGAEHAGNLGYIDTLGNIHSTINWHTEVMDGICAGPFGPIESHGMLHYLSTMQLAFVQAVRASRLVPAQ